VPKLIHTTVQLGLAGSVVHMDIRFGKINKSCFRCWRLQNF